MKAAITNTTSFLKSHIVGIILVGIFCSLTASFIYSWIHSPDASSKTSSAPSPLQLASSPVSFAEIVRVSNDSSLTQLQKDEFRRKHQGKLVEWTVRVRSVQRLYESRAESDFIVGFSPPEHKEDDRLALDGFASATFPAKLRDDMIDLHAGDIIRFRGTLEFFGQTPSVSNCQLLERHKP